MEKVIDFLSSIFSVIRPKRVSARTESFSDSTTIMPQDGYGAWMCVNIGTAAAKVMGFELQPGEGLDFTKAVPAGCKWDSPIQIEITPGAIVRVMRLQYKFNKNADRK